MKTSNAATSNQITSGMTINVGKKLYRVESSVRIKPKTGEAFIKTKLRDLLTDEIIEKNFRIDQEIKEVFLQERKLEFLYPEKEDFLFLDIDELEKVLISSTILDDKISFLKEGVVVKALFYGSSVFSIELPAFLELMVIKVKVIAKEKNMASSIKMAILETGAKIEVPSFIEVGDIIKIDTHKKEYIQRI